MQIAMKQFTRPTLSFKPPQRMLPLALSDRETPVFAAIYLSALSSSGAAAEEGSQI